MGIFLHREYANINTCYNELIDMILGHNAPWVKGNAELDDNSLWVCHYKGLYIPFVTEYSLHCCIRSLPE